MKKFFADTNFYLRYIVRDVPSQVKFVEETLQKAQKGEVSIVFSDPVILEMGFVLGSFYKTPREEIAKALLYLVKNNSFEIENRALWIVVFDFYSATSISLIDIYLFLRSKKEDAQVLSFDKDFRQLERLSEQN